MATYTTQLLRTFPLGPGAISQIPAASAGYACTASGNRTAQLTAAGCDVAIPPAAVATPSRSSTAVEVTYGAFSEAHELTVLHPRLTLGAASSTLRVLSPAACGPGAAAAGPAPPRWQSAAMYAAAHFQNPDEPAATITVDVSDRTPISADDPAITVSGGRMTASAVSAGAVVSVDAARGVNPAEASVQVDALADAVCVDPLRMVLASAAAAEVLQQSATAVTVRLMVSQRFEDPGDTGVVAVYAQSAGPGGVVLSEDITSEVRIRNRQHSNDQKKNAVGLRFSKYSGDLRFIRSHRKHDKLHIACIQIYADGTGESIALLRHVRHRPHMHLWRRALRCITTSLVPLCLPTCHSRRPPWTAAEAWCPVGHDRR